MNRPILFSTAAYAYLRDELLSKQHFLAGEIQSKAFPDGEFYHRILTDVDKQDCILIGGTIDDNNTLELYDLAQGLVHQGASSLSIVIPYFGYSTMERAVKPGEIVKAKNRALIFSSIPPGEESNKVYLMDLHSEGIPYYFDRDTRVHHIYCKQLIAELIAESGLTNPVLAATDAGRAKWVESLALDMGLESAFVYKQRLSGTETQITGVNALVQGRAVIIYDDMIRTGGSLMQAAQAYHDAGAQSIAAITTHGLFTNQAIYKIEAQGIIQSVSSLNTHPLSTRQRSPLLRVKSVSGIIFESLQ